MQKCNSWGSDLTHQGVSLLGIKVMLTWYGEMRLWGKMIWKGLQWVGKGDSLGLGLRQVGYFACLSRVFCLIVWFGCFFLFFWERVSSLGLAAPRSCSVDQTGLKITRDPPPSVPQVLGLKVCATTDWQSRFFINLGGHRLTVRAIWVLKPHGNC